MEFNEPGHEDAPPGSTVLDDYLHTHYHQAANYGSYEVLMRN